MYIESFSTRHQTTLTLIGISSPPYTKEQGLDFVLWTFTSNGAPLLYYTPSVGKFL